MKEKLKPYLPSKKFIIITIIIIILAVLIFVIFFMSSSGENFSISGNKKNLPLKIEDSSVLNLIQKDSDGDGVPDWEEALWGTDINKKMTFGDMPDATYIENKKKELKIETNGNVNATNLTETEKFAREFFTSYSAMKSSGQMDKNTINNFSSALGQKIVNPDLIDRYTEANLKINNTDTPITKQQYYLEIKKIFKSYQSVGLGDELSIVSNGLASSSEDTNNTNQYSKLTVIANAYQTFAKKIMEMSVPQSLVSFHLQIANNANNTGISVSNMGKIAKDPIIGLSGLSQYQKYSEALIKAVTDLETALK